MFAEKYYDFVISHAILMKFQVNIAQFNSIIMTNFYPISLKMKTSQLIWQRLFSVLSPRGFDVDISL